MIQFGATRYEDMEAAGLELLYRGSAACGGMLIRFEDNPAVPSKHSFFFFFLIGIPTE